MDFQGFSPETFNFFFHLGMHNDKFWFESHKDDYEKYVVAPALALIGDLDPLVRSLSPHYRGIPKKLGGSMMRIYRDVRFSKDKTPYKTNLGIQFRHESAKDVHAPGWYIHLDPVECFVGAGTWHPEPGDLLKIRRSLEGTPPYWSRILDESTSGTGLTLVGDSLQKVPRGFDSGHPLAREIRRKDFILSEDLKPELFMTRGLLDKLEASFRSSVPFMAALCQALGAPF